MIKVGKTYKNSYGDKVKIIYKLNHRMMWAYLGVINDDCVCYYDSAGKHHMNVDSLNLITPKPKKRKKRANNAATVVSYRKRLPSGVA